MVADRETGPVRVFAGLQCYAYALEELAGEKRGKFVSDAGALIAGGVFLKRGDEVLRELGIKPPDGPRPGCENIARAATRFELWGNIVVGDDDLPFVFYSKRSIPVGVWLVERPLKEIM